jgi:pimeloyl-ACP methyl ester carboxylesterase
VADIDGAGSGIVLVHAGVADRHLWDGIAPALTSTHTVARFDMRGYGDSPAPTTSYAPADDLVAVMDHAGLDRAVLVGSSFGALVAMMAAAAHPDRVTALALLAPPLPGHDWSAPLRAYFEAEEEALEAGDIDRAVALNLETWVRGPARRWTDRTRALAEGIRPALRTSLVNQAAMDEHSLDGDEPLAVALPGFAIATVVAVGEADQPDFVAIAERIAATVPGGRLVRLADVGHLIPLEAPAETVGLIGSVAG